MVTENGGAILVICFVLAFACASVYGQQKVFKWVDEHGVVHFSEEPPPDSSEVDVETIVTDPPPRHVPPARTQTQSPSASVAVIEKQRARPEPQVRPPEEALAIREMSLEYLDRRCEDAREKKIAPLREAEIAICVATETGDQAWCETFWADFGDSRRTVSGHLVPRMFHDLPECLEAWEERNRR